MKIHSHLSPVDMTYTMELKGLDYEAVRAVATFVQEQARFRGQTLDMSRIPPPQPMPRKLDLSNA